MNLGEYPTFFESFYFVRQNNCQFGLDANIENIATYFNLFSVVKLILVKIWHNSCNEFMSWSQKFPDVSLPDVTWTVSLMIRNTFWTLIDHIEVAFQKVRNRRPLRIFAAKKGIFRGVLYYTTSGICQNHVLSLWKDLCLMML